MSDVEVAEDMRVQRMHWRGERAGWVALAVFVTAALLGLFGGAGPLTLTTVAAEEGDLEVIHHRFERRGAPMTLQINVGDVGDADSVEVRFETAYLENFNVGSIVPQPDSVTGAGNEISFTFAREAGAEHLAILFNTTVDGMGPTSGTISVAGGPSVEVWNFFYP